MQLSLGSLNPGAIAFPVAFTENVTFLNIYNIKTGLE